MDEDYEYDEDYDDLLGDDEDGYNYADDLLGNDEVGVDWGRRRRSPRSRRAPGRGRRPPRGRRPSPRGRRPRTLALRPGVGSPRVLAAPPLIPPAPGVPQISGLYIPLGLGSFDFTNAAALTARVFIERPEKPVRPRRLWINTLRSAGAAAIGVDVSDIKIGTKSMLAGLLAIPAEQFAPGAFSTSYNLFDSAVPGVSVSVSIALSALPGAGENVFVSISMDCDSLG